jgi:hypothetical protein
MPQKPVVKPGKPDIRMPKAVRDQAKQMLESASWSGINFKEQLLQINHVRELMPIIDVLFPREQLTPSKLAETTQILIDAGMKIKYRDPFDPASIATQAQAYVTRTGRGKYEIFVNGNNEEEAFDSIDLHEKGHIYFSHTDGIKLYLKIFEREIDRVWDEKIAKWFTTEAKKHVKKDKIVQFLYAQFSNIAQDMEINSKLFEDEWVDVKRLMSRSAMIIHYKDLLDQFDDLSDLIRDDKARKVDSKGYKKLLDKWEFLVNQLDMRATGKMDDLQYCHPAQKDWPVKLDWMTYMTLLIKDIDDTMQQIANAINQMFAKGSGGGAGNSPASSGQGGGQSDSGDEEGDDGDSDSDSDSDGDGDGSGGGGGGGDKPISKDVLDQYFNEADAMDEAQSSNSGGAAGGDDDSFEEGELGGGSAGPSQGGHGKSKKGHGAWTGEISTAATFDDFVKILHKLCLGKKNRRMHSDVMYYSNRKKITGGVVVPRRHLIEKWVPTEVTIVVDVSGSVSTDYVERVINAIVDANSGIDLKNSHIIFCDTDVTSDEILSKRTKKAYSGGGTHIASGITYGLKYVKRPLDKMLIVSDFEDDLTTWTEAVKGHVGQFYAIGYNVHNSSNFDARKEVERFVPSNDAGKAFAKAFHILFIEELLND